MIICHISDGHTDTHIHWGGAEEACKRSIKMICDEKIDQFLITTKKEKNKTISIPHFEIEGVESFFSSKLKDFICGLKVIMFPFDPLVYFKCLRILKSYRPSVIHLHNFKILTFAVVAAAKKLGVPMIFSIYDYWLFCPKDNLYTNKYRACEGPTPFRCLFCYRPKDKRPLLITKLPLLFRQKICTHFLNKIDKFIALSNASKKLMAKYGILPERIEVIRQYYDTKVYKDSTIVKEPDTVLYTAWISPNKGAYAFIEIAAVVVKKLPHVKFFLAGEYRSKEFYTKVTTFITDHNLEKNVTLLGKKTHEEVSQLLQKYEIVVVPEQWENMAPIFLTEAMSWGKPIVASRMGGIPEFINDGVNGLLAYPYSPVEFADKICFFLKNKNMALTMGKRAETDAANFFGTDSIWKETVALYQRTGTSGS